jgi:hypothetical protein
MAESNQTVRCIIYRESERCGKLTTVCKSYKRRAKHHPPNVRYWGEADMPRPPAGFRSVAYDPN